MVTDPQATFPPHLHIAAFRLALPGSQDPWGQASLGLCLGCRMVVLVRLRLGEVLVWALASVYLHFLVFVFPNCKMRREGESRNLIMCVQKL